MTNKDDEKEEGGGDCSSSPLLVLPSELYSKFVLNAKKGTDGGGNLSSPSKEDESGSGIIDAEAMIQNMLSCLASLQEQQQQQQQQTTATDADADADENDDSRKKKKKIPPNNDIPKWIWKGLTTKGDDNIDDSSGLTSKRQKTNLTTTTATATATATTTTTTTTTTPNSNDVYYEWWMGIRYIQHFSSKLSPFELHSIAKESILFGGEDSSSSSSSPPILYSTLCLLICAYSLRQCPCPITKRLKRWQSLVCETIRLYQNYGIIMQQQQFDDNNNSNNNLSLWVDYVLPATLHVIQNLPCNNDDDDDDDVNRLPFVSALVGTTTHLAKRECEIPETTTNIQTIKTTTIQDHIQELLEDLRTILNQFGYSEIWVWINPWRATTKNRFAVTQRGTSDDEYNIDYMQNKDKIEWWNGYVHRHESVAGMDTSWDDELGISLLATLSFEDRPLVLSSNFIWKVWFPHVPTLLRSVTTTGTGGVLKFLEPLPLYLLDQLTKSTPEHSLPIVGSYSKKVDAPFETFQLLSNRILSMQAASIDSSPSEGGEQSRVLKARSENMVGLMKNLLTRYQTINQVKIVRKLVHDCPHPGLKAKFIDLLRPIVFNEEASDAFWTFIRSFVKDMLGHHDEKQRSLLNIDDLVEKVEIYVGIITMIQLWMMVNKGKLPPKISAKPLGRFCKTLNKKLKNWLLDDSNNNDDDHRHHEEENQALSLSQEVAARVEAAPDNYYRLYLLEGALQQVMDKKQSTGSSGEEDGSQSATPAAAPTSSAGPTSSNTKKTESAPVVGDADIFL